jgi:hypothetical protein
MKLLRVLAVFLVLLLLAGGGAYFLRDRLIGFWLERRLATELSEMLGADVELHGVRWQEGALRFSHGKVFGEKMPFNHLLLREVQALADWPTLLGRGDQPLHVEIAQAELVWRHQQPEHRSSAKAWSPTMDVVVGRFTFRHENLPGWELDQTALRMVRENDQWSFSARGGTLKVPDGPTLGVERASAEMKNGGWDFKSFALTHGKEGAIGGSAFHDSNGWSGEFSWQALPVVEFLPKLSQAFVAGMASGDGSLARGNFKGQMKIDGGESTQVSALSKLAGLFAGENWNTFPWKVFRFRFFRDAAGRVDFSHLAAVSSNGLAVSGEGHYAPTSIGANLQLGVRRSGRPWLTAFMPILFQEERDGYLWTPVRVSGTPENPSEDLTTRVAAAVAAAPAGIAVDAAAEIPGTAVEAAGNLMDKLFGR